MRRRGQRLGDWQRGSTRTRWWRRRHGHSSARRRRACERLLLCRHRGTQARRWRGQRDPLRFRQRRRRLWRRRCPRRQGQHSSARMLGAQRSLRRRHWWRGLRRERLLLCRHGGTRVWRRQGKSSSTRTFSAQRRLRRRRRWREWHRVRLLKCETRRWRRRVARRGARWPWRVAGRQPSGGRQWRPQWQVGGDASTLNDCALDERAAQSLALQQPPHSRLLRLHRLHPDPHRHVVRLLVDVLSWRRRER